MLNPLSGCAKIIKWNQFQYKMLFFKKYLNWYLIFFTSRSIPIRHVLLHFENIEKKLSNIFRNRQFLDCNCFCINILNEMISLKLFDCYKHLIIIIDNICVYFTTVLLLKYVASFCVFCILSFCKCYI